MKPNPDLITTYHNFNPGPLCKTVEDLPPFFSPFPCDTCSDKQAGDRYYCTATIGKEPTKPRETLEICEECFRYFFE